MADIHGGSAVARSFGFLSIVCFVWSAVSLVNFKFAVALLALSGSTLTAYAAYRLAGGPDNAAVAQLPPFTDHDIQADRVAAFVRSFMERDALAQPLLNPSNRELFAQGYRPTIGVPNDPEAGDKKAPDLESYFSRKLYLDISGVRPLT